jgi:hypothetical protein
VSKTKIASAAAPSAAAFLAGSTWAQQSPAPAAAAANPLDVVPDKMPFDVPYGAPISLEQDHRRHRVLGRHGLAG